MTLNEILYGVRERLDDPMRQHPSLRHLLRIATGHYQNFHNELSNTGVPWRVATWSLAVGPGQDEYLVTAADFGKVMYIHTVDPSGLHGGEREVQVVDPQNLDQFVRSHPLDATFGGSGGAEAIALYGTPQGDWKMKVRPVPREAAEYLVWYEAGRMPDLALGTEAPLKEHHHLLEVRIALASLPYAKWVGLTEQENQLKRRELGQVLAAERITFEEQWTRYITNQRQEQVHSRLAFGWEEDW